MYMNACSSCRHLTVVEADARIANLVTIPIVYAWAELDNTKAGKFESSISLLPGSQEAF